MFQQGYDAEIIEIEDQETFEIRDGYIGRLIENNDEDDENENVSFQDAEDEFENDETVYLISDMEDLEDKYDFELDGDLTEGKYKFIAKHNAIFLIDYSLNF